MKCERKSTFVLCRGGLASILILPKSHVCYTTIKLIDTFSTSYFFKANEYMLPLNYPSHKNYQRALMIGIDSSDGLWNCRWFRIKHAESSDSLWKLCEFRIKYAELSHDLQCLQNFVSNVQNQPSDQQN